MKFILLLPVAMAAIALHGRDRCCRRNSRGEGECGADETNRYEEGEGWRRGRAKTTSAVKLPLRDRIFQREQGSWGR